MGKTGLDKWRRVERSITLIRDELPKEEIVVKRPFGPFTWTAINFNVRDRHQR